MNTKTNVQENAARKTTGTRILAGAGTGFAGLFLLPILGILGVSFVAIGAGLPVLSILNLIGITHIPFNVLFWQIVGLPQVLVAVVVGAVFMALGLLCFFSLKKFFAFSRSLTR